MVASVTFKIRKSQYFKNLLRPLPPLVPQSIRGARTTPLEYLRGGCCSWSFIQSASECARYASAGTSRPVVFNRRRRRRGRGRSAGRRLSVVRRRAARAAGRLAVSAGRRRPLDRRGPPRRRARPPRRRRRPSGTAAESVRDVSPACRRPAAAGALPSTHRYARRHSRCQHGHHCRWCFRSATD